MPDDRSIEKSGAAKPAEIVKFNPARTAEEIRTLVKFDAALMVEIGIKLLDAKEGLKRGEFLPWLETTGIQNRTAQRYMHVAARMRHRVALLGDTSVAKVQALAELPDEDLQEIFEGRGARGLTKDIIDEMSATELRVALRDEKGQVARGTRQLAKARDRIDLLSGRKLPEETAAALSRIDKEIVLGESIVTNLEAMIAEIEKSDEHAELRKRYLAAGIGRLAAAFDGLVRVADEDLGLEPLSPDQLRAVRALDESYEKRLAAKKPKRKGAKR